jgi:hypothetical protein
MDRDVGMDSSPETDENENTVSFQDILDGSLGFHKWRQLTLEELNERLV